VLSNDFYVDELLRGTSNKEDAIKVQVASNSRIYTEEVGFKPFYILG